MPLQSYLTLALKAFNTWKNDTLFCPNEGVCNNELAFCRSRALRDWIKKQAGAVLDGFSTSFTSAQRAVRGASFLLNLAVLSQEEPLGAELNVQAVSILAHLLSVVPPDDEEALHR